MAMEVLAVGKVIRHSVRYYALSLYRPRIKLSVGSRVRLMVAIQTPDGNIIYEGPLDGKVIYVGSRAAKIYISARYAAVLERAYREGALIYVTTV